MSASKSILSYLKPVIWVSKIYGCLPFTFKEYDDESIKVKKFLISIIYGMILVFPTALYRIIVNVFYEKRFLSRPIHAYSAILGSISSLISYVSYLCYLKDIQGIFEENLEFSKLIKKKNFLKNVFWLTFGEILLAEFMSLGYYILYPLLYPKLFILNEMIMEHYLRFVITLFRFQFSNSLLLIFFVFKSINEEITEKKKSNTMLDLSFKKMDLNLLDAMKLHSKACDSCELLNKCFGPTLAFASICMMLQVVLCCYVLVTNQITIIMFLFWFCSYVIEEWFVLFACEKVVGESKRTGILVHHLMAHTKDPRVKEQLQQFSLQLLHRKLEFSACGLFPLNYTLIYSIAGAVTTYLVILLQMQSGPSSKSS